MNPTSERVWRGRGPPRRFETGVLPSEVDVVVVGGTLTGVATALFLAREDVRVALVEPAPFIGTGESGLGMGAVELGVVEYPHRTVRALGERVHELYGFTDDNKALLEAEGLFDRCGVLWVALQDNETDAPQETARALEALGREAEPLSTEATTVATGAPLGPGVRIVGDGRIDPFGALLTLLERARDAGVHIACGSMPRIESDDPLLVRVADQRVQAEILVLASPEAATLDPRLASGLTSVREQCLVTAPVSIPDPGLGRAGHGWTSWRPHPTGGIQVAGCRWATPHMEVGETDASVVQPVIQARLEGFVRDRLSIGATIVDRFAWTFADTRDGLPVIGPIPGQPRRVAATGFGANPASFALAAARSVADGLLEGEGTLPFLLSSRRLIRWSR